VILIVLPVGISLTNGHLAVRHCDLRASCLDGDRLGRSVRSRSGASLVEPAEVGALSPASALQSHVRRRVERPAILFRPAETCQADRQGTRWPVTHGGPGSRMAPVTRTRRLPCSCPARYLLLTRFMLLRSSRPPGSRKPMRCPAVGPLWHTSPRCCRWWGHGRRSLPGGSAMRFPVILLWSVGGAAVALAPEVLQSLPG